MALLLDSLLNPTLQAKASIQRSALVRTRRALRSVRQMIIGLLLANLNQSPQHLRVVMATLLSQSKGLLSLAAIPLLCTAIDVARHLKKDDVVPEEIRVKAVLTLLIGLLIDAML